MYSSSMQKMCFVLKCLPSNSEAISDDNTVEEETTHNISFTINDGTDAIGGATVTIGEESKTTGSAGGCSFNNIAEGEVTVTVSAEGYETATETITVDSENTSFTISLTAETPSEP